MSERPEPDPLADLLNSVALPAADPSRREAIFAQTRGVLKTRRIVRRGLWGGALAACYVCGVLSVLGWQSFHAGSKQATLPSDVQENRPATVPEAQTNPPSNLSSEPTLEPQPMASSEDVQHPLAQNQPAETLTTFEKLRRAGDRQLKERGNLHGAIGCYRRALEFARDDELVIVPDRDSWLLISLKESHSQERKHVHKKS